MPQADAGGNSDKSAGYYVNDLARSIIQDGATQTLELDPLQRMATKVKTGATSSTESYAYDGDSDSPAWAQTGTSWTRFAAGIGGDMEATQASFGSVKVAINNCVYCYMTYSSTAEGSGYRMAATIRNGACGSAWANLTYDAPINATIIRVHFTQVVHSPA